MFDFFDAVKGLLKTDRVSIDDNVFRLHYRITAVALLMFSMIITAKQYVGDPIKCMVDGVPSEIMDYYCWIYATFTVPLKAGGRNATAVHPGVSAYVEGDKIKYHKYYQWVYFVLFFQAFCFYVPRFLWKSWEGGRVRTLSLDLNARAICGGDGDRDKHVEALIGYFSKNLHTQNFYLARYVFCECLNFANVIGQIVFLDYFLEGEFRTYGIDVLRFTDAEPEKRVDPMARVFPKVTKCLFQNYGPSGNVQRFDGLCVLPLNIVNEKIFMFLWCWFLVVAVLSGVNLVYRPLVVLVPQLRCFLLKSSSLLTPSAKIRTVVGKCQVGSWFVLYQLSQNVDPTVFMELLTGLANALDGHKTRTQQLP